jgi:hypothetical protein
LELYEELRHQIPHFDELTPEHRQVTFDRVWKLRQHVEANQDDLPDPGTALLHDSLTHAALYFLEVYDQERQQGSDRTKSGALVGLDDYRNQLKAS